MKNTDGDKKARGIFSVISIFFAAPIIIIASVAVSGELIILEDDFNRADSIPLGGQWIQENQTFTESISPTGFLVGPSHTSVENNKLSFNYFTHSLRPNNIFNFSNHGLLVYHPLNVDSNGTPAVIKFDFRTIEDETTSYEIGLMNSSDGFISPGDGRIVNKDLRPTNGIGINFGRTSKIRTNSQINITNYIDGVAIFTNQLLLPFQISYGIDYHVEIFIDSDHSVVASISNGTVISTTSGTPIPFEKPLDQLFITGVQMQLTSLTPERISDHATFDNVVVSLIDIIDSDEDGIFDIADNCPNDPNPLQGDNDEDDVGDICDLDDDNDTVADLDDNCPLVANRLQTDDDFDGLGNACDGTYDAGSVAQYIDDVASVAVQDITFANPPGGNGMISKLTGNGGVLRRIANAVSAFNAGVIDTDTYLAELQGALDKLDAFDDQLDAKIGNGQIVDPEATNLLDGSAEIRATIDGLIVNAGG